MVDAEDKPSKSPIEVQLAATVALPFTLRLPDGIYNCKYGRHEFIIETHYVEESLGEKLASGQSVVDAEGREQQGTIMFHLATGRFTSATGAHIPGAMLRYTFVKVAFCRRLPGPEITSDDNLSNRDYVHKFINHFLYHYRFIADDDTIRPLSRSELHQVRAGHAFHFLTNHVTDGQGRLGAGVMFDESDPMSVGGTRIIADDKLLVFREKLLANEKPAMPHLLLLNAKGYIRSGETRFAVINMNTALDIAVEKKAAEILVAEGKESKDIQAYLEPKSTSSIVSTILLPLIPEERRPSKDWDERYSIHRVLRNKVIHDGYLPSEHGAKNSLVNFGKLCAYFLSLQSSSAG